MSDANIEIPSNPRETVRAARAVFGRNNFFMLMGDQLEIILEGIKLECISNPTVNSRIGETTLPLVTFLQYTEGLTDEQSLDAMRARVDWKYALHLPVNILSFHENSLCEYRQRVWNDPDCQRELQKMINRLIELNPPLQHDAPQITVENLLLDICSINLLTRAWDAMCASLGVLAGSFPDWLRRTAKPHWYGRYNDLRSTTSYVTSERQREDDVNELSRDIQYLLEQIQRSNLPQMSELKEIKVLQDIWKYQYKNWGFSLRNLDETSKWLGCDFCINRIGLKGGTSSKLL